MGKMTDSFDGMLAAWNEGDPKAIRGHLNRSLAENVHFVDPNYDIVGKDEFEKMVHAVQQKVPGAVYSHVGKIDWHHNVARYHWAIHVDGKLIMPGFDVTKVRNDGLVIEVIGFFGLLEAGYM